MSLPASELESLLSAADSLQLSLLHSDHNQLTANQEISIQAQQEWQCASNNGIAEQDLKTEMKTIADKGIETKPQLAALRKNYRHLNIIDKKTGPGASTLNKFIKSNGISTSRVQMDHTDMNDSEQVDKKACCSECGKEFEAFNHLWVHIQSMHHKRYRCKNCGKTYSNADVLNQHIDSAHNGIRLVCQDCGIKFSFQASFNRHIKKKHSGVVDQQK